MNQSFTRLAFGAALATSSVLLPLPCLHAASDIDQTKVRIGFEMVPAPLNAVSDFNGCHTLSPPQWHSPGGSPFFSQVNPDVYRGGGQGFCNVPAPPFVEIVSRSVTLDKEGKPAGVTLVEFLRVIGARVDLDKWRPACTGAPKARCVPAPFDGSLPQVMPWPAFQLMSETELIAIYRDLAAVPCLKGAPGNPAGSDTNGTRCR